MELYMGVEVYQHAPAVRAGRIGLRRRERLPASLIIKRSPRLSCGLLPKGKWNSDQDDLQRQDCRGDAEVTPINTAAETKHVHRTLAFISTKAGVCRSPLALSVLRRRVRICACVCVRVLLLEQKGKHAFKFIVDDEWRFAPDQPTVADIEGRVNNFIDVSDFVGYTGEENFEANRMKVGVLDLVGCWSWRLWL